MRVLPTMILAVGLLVAGCASGGDNGSGAVTELDEVGPDIAELQARVETLDREVRVLDARVTTLEQQVPG